VLAAVENSPEIDPGQALEVLGRVILELHAGCHPGDTGVVEHDVETTEGTHGGLNGPGDIVLRADVATLCHRLAILLGNQCCRLLRPVLTDISADHGGALLREAQRRGTTYTGPGAGDDGDLAGQQLTVSHSTTPSLFNAMISSQS